MSRKFDNEVELQIIAEYENGSSSIALAKKYSCNKTTICAILKRHSVSARQGAFERKYSFNEHFLDCIDTEEKAHFLGFFFADGCNYEDRNKTTILINTVDEDLLEKYVTILCSNRPLRYEREGKLVAMDLGSKYFCGRLAQLGAIAHKSLVLQFPKELPHDMVRHFIRGYFDGDGCVSLREHKNGTVTGRVNIVGSHAFIQSLAEIIKTEILVDCHIDIRGNCSALRIDKKQDAFDFLKWIYDGSTLYLNRKHNKFCKLKKFML